MAPFSLSLHIIISLCVWREMPSRINRLIHPERHQFYVMVSRLFFLFFVEIFFFSLSYPFMNIHEWNEFGPSSSSRKPIALYIFGFLIFDDYINRPCSSSSSFWPSHAAVCCVCAHSFIIFLTFNFQSFKPLFLFVHFFISPLLCVYNFSPRGNSPLSYFNSCLWLLRVQLENCVVLFSCFFVFPFHSRHQATR